MARTSITSLRLTDTDRTRLASIGQDLAAEQGASEPYPLAETVRRLVNAEWARRNPLTGNGKKKTSKNRI